MGNKESTPKVPVVKEGDIKIDSNNLPTLNTNKISLPKPPVAIKSRKQEKADAEKAEEAKKIQFSLADEFDLSTYYGRF